MTLFTKNGVSHFFLFVLLVAVMFAAPLGASSISVRFTDLVAVFIIMTLVAVLAMKTTVRRYRLTAPLIILFVFVCMEVILPIIGIAVWGNISAASSTLRAILYWAPFLFVTLLIYDERLENIKIYRKLMIVALFVNVSVAAIELASYFNLVPSSLNIRNYFAVFAMEGRYHYQRIWSAGLFINSTQLAAFSFILFCHFLSLAISENKKTSNLMMALLAFMLILLTTSRTPLLASIIVLGMFVLVLKNTVYTVILKAILAITTLFALRFIIFSKMELFHRYARLMDGLDSDYSLGRRVNELWPRAITFYQNLGHPTFTNPVGFIGVIDSGFLTYYVQGGPFFVFVMALIPISLFFGAVRRLYIKKHKEYIDLMAMFISVYLMLGAITTNPFRNIVVIAFVVLVVVFYSKLTTELRGLRAAS